MQQESDLWTALRAAASKGRGSVTFHGSRETATEMPSSRLVKDAEDAARALAGVGVRPGDTVGVLGPNSVEWAVWAFATWAAGATLVPLPYPVMQDVESAAGHADRLAQAAGCRLVLATPTLAEVRKLRRAVPWDRPPAPPSRLPSFERGDVPAVVQFTSGSTSDPKGAELSHRAVLTAVGARLAARDEPDAGVLASWLPMFHDWGLFGGLVTPFVAGGRAHVLPVDRFVADPVGWLRLATDVGATTIPGPPSIWPALLRRLGTDPGGVDLSAVRLCILAAELVDPALVELLEARGPAIGLRPTALASGFGMAEAVLTVTTTRPGDGITIDRVDRLAMETRGEAAPARSSDQPKRVVGSGHPVPGMSVRVVGAAGPLPERRVGSIEIAGPQLLSAYHGRPGLAHGADGWFRTGDLGYVVGGQLFVTGREKDLVIVRGHNIAPQDLEWAAEHTRGVRRGRTVAIPAEAEGEVALVVEPSRGARPSALIVEVRRTLIREAGILPTEVVVVPRGTMPRTTSGKLRRQETRDGIASGRLEILARG